MHVVRKHFESIDSTNTWAKLNAIHLPPDQITLITADIQTAGRGRFKRAWISPEGVNIYATFCFFLEKHRKDLGNLPQILALGAAETLSDKDFNVKLKWPNDVLIGGKKVAGILCETTVVSSKLCIALGIGLNVNMGADILSQIDRPATSLLVEGGVMVDVEEVLEKLQARFVRDYEIYLEKGFPPFLQAYRQRMGYLRGDRLKFDDNRAIWEGKFIEITEHGALQLELLSGEIRDFIAGEILF